jgi:large subunit ribosomal protein L24
MTNTESIKLTIRKNDQVQVISGREKGKIGKIVSIDRKNMQVVVEKVNMVKRHTKPTQKAPQGGILEKEAPLHYSNVLLFCQKCNRGVRHGIKVGGDAKKGSKTAAAGKAKMRVCKKCGSSLELQ